jgi:hypothetical protein
VSTVRQLPRQRLPQPGVDLLSRVQLYVRGDERVDIESDDRFGVPRAFVCLWRDVCGESGDRDCKRTANDRSPLR